MDPASTANPMNRETFTRKGRRRGALDRAIKTPGLINSLPQAAD
jgi:hypothetical protein